MRDTERIERYYLWFQNNWLSVLIGVYVCFIIYTTIVPFRFSRDIDFILRRFHQIDWNPFFYRGRFISRADIVANIIFFMPLGILLGIRKLLGKGHLSGWKGWVRIGAYGGFISTFVEFLQVFTYDRYPSVADVFTNIIGTILGAMLAKAVYLGANEAIKARLKLIFIEKPEMIFAGLLLLFIFIGQSAPFTFDISIHSVSAQIREFRQHPFRVNHLLTDLTLNLLMYGNFAYFLFSGIERYFSASFKSRSYLLILLLSLLFPFCVELYQLLLPCRNHSIGDVLLAQSGIFLGGAIVIYQYFHLQNNSSTLHFRHSVYGYRHAQFFGIMGIIYLLFIFCRIFFPLNFTSSGLDFKEVIHEDTTSIVYLIRYHRLDLVISMVKEAFAFLPTGFLVALIWFMKTKRPIPLILIWLTVILIPCLAFAASLLFVQQHMNGFEIPAAGVGIWLGSVSWYIYEFIVEFRSVYA